MTDQQRPQALPRRVVLLAVTDGDTDATLPGAPFVADADNLRDAARAVERSAAERGPGRAALVRVDTTGAAGSTAIAFAPDPRLLAGLVGDVVLAEVADGAVLVVAGDPAARRRLHRAIVAHLGAAGFRVTGEAVDSAPVRLSS